MPQLRNEYRHEEAAKGYESPTFDLLKPQWQRFVLAWLRTMDYEQAALDAGYTAKTAYDQGFRLARDPKIVQAIEELCDRRLNAVEQSRASVTHRLMLESTVSKADLCGVKVDEDGNTFEYILPYTEIEETWRPCIGLVEYTRERDVRFNTTQQNNARKLLATYMKWDREPADVTPPMYFDFGNLKPESIGEVPPTPDTGYLADKHADNESAKNKNGRKTSKELNGS